MAGTQGQVCNFPDFSPHIVFPSSSSSPLASSSSRNETRGANQEGDSQEKKGLRGGSSKGERIGAQVRAPPRPTSFRTQNELFSPSSFLLITSYPVMLSRTKTWGIQGKLLYILLWSRATLNFPFLSGFAFRPFHLQTSLSLSHLTSSLPLIHFFHVYDPLWSLGQKKKGWRVKEKKELASRIPILVGPEPVLFVILRVSIARLDRPFVKLVTHLVCPWY